MLETCDDKFCARRPAKKELDEVVDQCGSEVNDLVIVVEESASWRVVIFSLPL